MAVKFKKFTDRISDAWDNPELDETKAALAKAILESGTTAIDLQRALAVLDEEMTKLGKSDEERSQLKKDFERRFRVFTGNNEREAVLKSPEAIHIDAFVDDFAVYSRLNEAIERSRKEKSKDPLFRIIQTARASTPLLAGLGAGLMKFLAEGQAEEKKKGKKGNPSKLEAAATRADAALEEAKTKTKKKKDDKKEDRKEADTTLKASASSPRTAGPSAEMVSSAAEPDVNVDRPRRGPIKYEPNPEYSKRKLSGKEFLAKYKTIKDRHERHMFALQQIALGNVPAHFNQFEHMRITGRKGTKIEFEVARHNQRIGTDSDYVEVPFDGPTASAAAKIQDCHLANPWIVEQVYEKAKRDGGVITFYGGQDLARKAGKKDWDNWMLSAEGMAQAFELRREEFRGREGQITAGHFKAVNPPNANDIEHQWLNAQGGHFETGKKVQGYMGGFHDDTYSDASHGIRLVRNGSLYVNGEPMSWDDFYADPDLARELGFDVIPKGAKYAGTPALNQFIAENSPEEDKQKNEKRPEAVAMTEEPKDKPKEKLL
ncbi:hypothetical protein JXD20_02950 [Candidatus Peregrinibacteria bacterium]|nr:hypothetical protein [Candidatus Peregrinibacteria bacterium]